MEKQSEELLQLEKAIELEYNSFFTSQGIGFANKDFTKDGKLFATMPFIGENYLEAKTKILFVGLDMGKQEHSTCQDFKARRENIDGNSMIHNPHISGTYVSALYLLKDEYNWQQKWAEYEKSDSTMLHTMRLNSEPHKDLSVLSLVALTNFYKYVTLNRKDRSGDLDRRRTNNYEDSLFLKEVELLKPDIIFFQSLRFANHPIINKLHNVTVIIAPHPSLRGVAKCRVPRNYINKMNTVK